MPIKKERNDVVQQITYNYKKNYVITFLFIKRSNFTLNKIIIFYNNRTFNSKIVFLFEVITQFWYLYKIKNRFLSPPPKNNQLQMVCLFIELVCLLHTLWFKLHILTEVKVFRSSVFRGSMSNDPMKPSSITLCQSSSRKGWIWDSSKTPLHIPAAPSYPKDFADYATSHWEQYCQLHQKQNICFPWQLHVVIWGEATNMQGFKLFNSRTQQEKKQPVAQMHSEWKSLYSTTDAAIKKKKTTFRYKIYT